jgi:hypothetical protein
MNSFDTIEKCVDYLAPLEAFQNLVEFINDDYETAIDDLNSCDKQMLDRQVGRVTTYREILSILEKL